MSEKDKVWYKCVNCNRYLFITESEAINKHLNWNHQIYPRIPPKFRTAYKSTGKKLAKVKVDDLVWFVAMELLNFKNYRGNPFTPPSRWYFNGSSPLDGDLNETAKRLSHLYYPTAQITRKQLEKLIVESIRSGRYQELNRNTVKLRFCLDSDTKLQPRNPSSKWTTITPAELSRLIKSDAQVEKEMLDYVRKR